jgi:hypothetical protein
MLLFCFSRRGENQGFLKRSWKGGTKKQPVEAADVEAVKHLQPQLSPLVFACGGRCER